MAGASYVLLEDGTSHLLQEDGASGILLQYATAAPLAFLQQVDTSYFLLPDGVSRLALESLSGAFDNTVLAAAPAIAVAASGDIRTTPLAAAATVTFAASAFIPQGTHVVAAAGVAIGTAATLDDVDLVVPVLTTRGRLEVQLSPGVWTNLGRDVCGTPPVHFVRGCTQNGPLDHVAAIGTLEFDLRNDAGNSGGVQGWYSPNFAHARPGWTYGVAVRLIATYQSHLLGDAAPVDHPLWRGKVTTISPVPGLYNERRVSVVAQDCMGDLAASDAVSIPPQLNQTEVQLMNAVLAAMPTTAQPPATNFDAAVDTYPYAFDNLGTGVKGLSAMTDVVLSAYGWLYPLADGTLRYENRQTRARRTAVFTFNDKRLTALTVPTDLANVFNRIRVTIHPRTIDATPTAVLVAATTAVAIDPGQTITTTDNYRVQGNGNSQTLIGGTGFITPLVPHTDYAGNTLADGSGTDLTASLSVAVTPFAAAAVFAVTNTSAVQGFITVRQLRGKGIYDNSPTTFESYTPEPYGDQPLDIDLAYQTNSATAAAFGDFILNLYAAQTNHADEVGFEPVRSDLLMSHALTREIGDMIVVSETMTGLAGAPLSILGIDGTLSQDRRFTVNYIVAPTGIGLAFILDDATHGVLDSIQAPLWYA